MLQWILEHKAVLFPLGVAIIDFVMALIPSMKSNGIVHWAYLALGGKETA